MSDAQVWLESSTDTHTNGKPRDERQLSTGGEAHVTLSGVPKEPVQFQVSGANSSSQLPLTHSATVKAMITINTADDVEAATELYNESANVKYILPGEVVEIKSPEAAITRVSVILLVTGGTAGDALTKRAADTEAQVSTSLRTFVALASDDCRLVNIGLADTGIQTQNQIFIEGFKHA